MSTEPASYLLEVRKVPRASALPVAGELLLKPCFSVSFPLNESFKSYLLYSHGETELLAGSVACTVDVLENGLLKG